MTKRVICGVFCAMVTWALRGKKYTFLPLSSTAFISIYTALLEIVTGVKARSSTLEENMTFRLLAPNGIEFVIWSD